MNQGNALRGASTGLQAVPAPVPEIQSEIARLQVALDRVEGYFGDLAQRLHSVRADEDCKAAVTEAEAPTYTKLGGSLREMTYRLNALSDQIAYQTHTLQLPA